MAKFDSAFARKTAYCANVPREMKTEEVLRRLESDGFFTHPSSTKYHGAYEGGGFDHAHNVAYLLQKWTSIGLIRWRLKRSPLLIGYWHDLCKLGAYAPEGEAFKRIPQVLTGHGEVSAMHANKLLHYADADLLNTEEVMCIWYHMGPYLGADKWSTYDLAVRQCPNILWVHHADMVASKVLEE